MEPEGLPRQLKEKTEKHRCVKCLREVPKDEYLENDFFCDHCAESEKKPEETKSEG